MTGAQEQKLKGWHVFAGFAAAFTVIIGVNLVLAFDAVRTFPGLVVENSYVASQTFDARRAAQIALGWTAEAKLEGDTLRLSFRDKQGQPVQPAKLTALLGRPTEAKEDRFPEFVFDGADFVAPVDLHQGNWNLRIEAEAADGTLFAQRLDLFKKG